MMRDFSMAGRRRCNPRSAIRDLRLRPSRAVGVSVVVMLAMVLPTGAVADEPTLDELLEIEPGQPAEREAEPERDAEREAVERPGVDLEDDIRRMLRGEEVADAFEQAVRQMDGVARRLGSDLDPGLVTQREQESILAKLDQVIEAARQQQMSPQGGDGDGDGDDQQQARDQDAGAEDLAQQARDAQAGEAEGQAGQAEGSTAAGDDASPGSVVEAEQGEGALEELRREWGQLPPRLRDEISEGLQERFSPAYRSMTEAYYRRLAEED
ncbi:hypothetical protein ACERK3_00995 [Phycisphaerales bacterium AB-hyl4]|uniref:Uncharacterized protein n=1 Tax=Natronomicrosphaera hydrolytica TaxID=3242702 RepID=A0ABV4U3H9_9BACT